MWGKSLPKGVPTFTQCYPGNKSRVFFPSFIFTSLLPRRFCTCAGHSQKHFLGSRSLWNTAELVIPACRKGPTWRESCCRWPVRAAARRDTALGEGLRLLQVLRSCAAFSDARHSMYTSLHICSAGISLSSVFRPVIWFPNSSFLVD